jgi:hypothetical protein
LEDSQTEEEGHPSLQAAAEVVVVEEACCFEEQ